MFAQLSVTTIYMDFGTEMLIGVCFRGLVSQECVRLWGARDYLVAHVEAHCPPHGRLVPIHVSVDKTIDLAGHRKYVALHGVGRGIH